MNLHRPNATKLSTVRKPWSVQRGSALTETVLLALGIAVFAIAVILVMGDNIRALLSSSCNALAGQDSTPVTRLAPPQSPGFGHGLGSGSSALMSFAQNRSQLKAGPPLDLDFDRMADLWDAGHVMVAGTIYQNESTQGDLISNDTLVARHAYYVLHVDCEKRMVHVADPNGWDLGVVQLTWEQFTGNFSQYANVRPPGERRDPNTER